MEALQGHSGFAKKLVVSSHKIAVSAGAGIYEALGVPPTATAEELREAYYAQARALHPDHNPDDPAAEETFKSIASLAEIVRDPRMRKLYDRGDIDASGRLTPKGAGRRRRAAACRVFAAYFLCPFAAGMAGLCALLWTQAPNAPQAPLVNVASAQTDSSQTRVALANSERVLTERLGRPDSLTTASKQPLAAAHGDSLVRLASLESKESKSIEQINAPSLVISKREAFQAKETHRAIDGARQADRGSRIPSADFEARVGAAAQDLAVVMETRVPAPNAASRQKSGNPVIKNTKQRGASILSRVRERRGKPERQAAKKAQKSTVVALASEAVGSGDLPFARQTCQLTKACRLNQEWCGC